MSHSRRRSPHGRCVLARRTQARSARPGAGWILFAAGGVFAAGGATLAVSCGPESAQPAPDNGPAAPRGASGPSVQDAKVEPAAGQPGRTDGGALQRRSSRDEELTAEARELHPEITRAVLYSAVEWCNRPSADLPSDVLNTIMTVRLVPFAGPMADASEERVVGHWFDTESGTAYVDVAFARRLLDARTEADPERAAPLSVLVALSFNLADAVLATRGASADSAQRATIAGAITRRILLRPDQQTSVGTAEIERALGTIDAQWAGDAAAGRTHLLFPAEERAEVAARYVAGFNQPRSCAAR